MGKKASLIRRVISRLKKECPNCKIPLEARTELIRKFGNEVASNPQYEHWIEIYRETSSCNTCDHSRTKTYDKKQHKEREGYDPGDEDNKGPGSSSGMKSQGFPM
tara:strand:+ start:329 stop:643 length:315 start_codon:yes stop_codon:yes gene_type:complete